MPEEQPSRAEAVLPSLLDRLVPETALAEALPRRRRRERAVEAVERDLWWLFNTGSPLSHMAPQDLLRRPQVAASVLNFGLRDIFGRVVRDPGEIERAVAEALERFEPRMQVEKLTVELTSEGQVLEIRIEGTLLMPRMTRQVWIRTDLETLASEVVEAEAHG